jgi:enoyl-CoA hydratase
VSYAQHEHISGTGNPSEAVAADAPVLVLVDEPAPGVRRITLNRPEKRNALNHHLRGQLIAALHDGDDDPDVRVQIVRGAGTCFSAGYELGGGNEGVPLPHFTAGGEGQWPRHVTETWMSIWDLAKPVIAQVHGYCLAGGSELATGCDLVYVADDAKIGYPAVRFGTPDMQYHAWLFGMRAGMESMLTGDSFSGVEAAQLGWANRAYPEAELEENVLAIAARIAQIPSDLVQINKRTVHRAMEFQGVRTATRAGSELQGLASNLETSKQFFGGDLSAAVKQAAQKE